MSAISLAVAIKYFIFLGGGGGIKDTCQLTKVTNVTKASNIIYLCPNEFRFVSKF